MRYLITMVALTLSAALAGPIRADENEAGGSAKNAKHPSPEMRQKILEEFDADGDGKMSDDERATARETMRARRGGGDREGRRRGGGDHQRPDPAKLFDRFDEDQDGQLSRDEFMKLSEAVHQMRERAHGGEARGRRPRPPEGREGRGESRRGPRPEGPPPRGERRFDRPAQFQNPGGRPGSRVGGGNRQRGGQAGRPSPAEVFNRFDENNDDQLSRSEFMKLAEKMRSMRESQGRGGKAHGRKGRQKSGQKGGRPPRGRKGQGRDINKGAGALPDVGAIEANSV